MIHLFSMIFPLEMGDFELPRSVFGQDTEIFPCLRVMV